MGTSLDAIYHCLFLQEVVNVTASHGVFVRVRAGINIVTNEATWELQTLDPETGT